jgi:hypothetical protein
MPVAELARQVRVHEKPTTADAQARHEARHLRMWWSDGHAMLYLRGGLADVDGATFASTIHALTDQMRPTKGQPWDRWEHRAADALVALCDHATADATNADEPLLAPRPLFVVDVPLTGPATVAGIPIADSILEQWRAHADLEARLVDGDGALVDLGRKHPALSAKLARAILLRDQECRICGARHGLQIHHLQPRSWGGRDDFGNTAMVCGRGPQACHPLLVPHGRYALVGNPNVVDALRMVHLDDLTDDQADQIGLPDALRKRNMNRPRAGPEAA